MKGNRWIYDKTSNSKTLRDRHNQTVATVYPDFSVAFGGAVSWWSTGERAMQAAVDMAEQAGIVLAPIGREHESAT